MNSLIKCPSLKVQLCLCVLAVFGITLFSAHFSSHRKSLWHRGWQQVHSVRNYFAVKQASESDSFFDPYSYPEDTTGSPYWTTPISPTPVVDSSVEPDIDVKELVSKRHSSTNLDIGPDNVSDSSRYVIYRCDGSRMCGGWSDRVKGILNAYVIANLTGRTFKLEMLSPKCDMLDFFHPNLVNWSLPMSFHKVVRESRDVRIYNRVDDSRIRYTIGKIDFFSLPEMRAKYVYLSINRHCLIGLRDSTLYKEQLSWMKGLTRAQLQAGLFNRLFKLSPRLEKVLDSFLSTRVKPGDKLACAHLRLGQSPTMPRDAKRTISKDCLPTVWNFLANATKKSPSSKIFLMSDTEKALTLAQDQPPIKDRLMTLPGDIVHIERSRGLSREKMCDGFEKVLLEMFILTRCDTLLLTKSGLSRLASYLRDTDRGLYCLMDDGSIQPCHRGSLLELYGLWH